MYGSGLSLFVIITCVTVLIVVLPVVLCPFCKSVEYN